MLLQYGPSLTPIKMKRNGKDGTTVVPFSFSPSLLISKPNVDIVDRMYSFQENEIQKVEIVLFSISSLLV